MGPELAPHNGDQSTSHPFDADVDRGSVGSKETPGNGMGAPMSRLSEVVAAVVDIPLPSPEVNRRVLKDGEDPLQISLCNICWTSKRVEFFYLKVPKYRRYTSECIWCQKRVKRASRAARRVGFEEREGRWEATRQIREISLSQHPDWAVAITQTTRHGHHWPFPPLEEDWVSRAACIHPSLPAARKCKHHREVGWLWSMCAHPCLEGAPRQWREDSEALLQGTDPE